MSVLFGIAMVVATIVIFAPGSQLPAEVASHFNGSGHADATMSSGAYLTVMAVLANGVPVLTWRLQHRAARLGRVNIPHREFWLAPERRAETLRFMSRHAMAMSLALLVLLVSVHLLVVKAHLAGEVRPVLDMHAFFAVLWVFVVFSLLWIAGMFRRFRSPT